ncbi:hypothetical protein IWW50_007060, partial [Coemansia erecta]
MSQSNPALNYLSLNMNVGRLATDVASAQFNMPRNLEESAFSTTHSENDHSQHYYRNQPLPPPPPPP